MLIPVAPVVDSAYSSLQLLVVDDEQSVLNAVSRCFLDTPLEVITATSAQAALDLLQNGLQVALIISDYRMPGMNGVEFLQQVMQHWPGIKRVILSAYPDTEVLLAAVNEGRVDRFITKPWENSGLRLVVQELLEEKDQLASVRAEVLDLVQRNKVLASTNQQLSVLLNNLLQTVRGDSSSISSALSSSGTDVANTARHQHLSPRECQILKAFATGQKPKEIAHNLGISVKTVSTYKLRLSEKMGFSSDAALISYALTHHIISNP